MSPKKRQATTELRLEVDIEVLTLLTGSREPVKASDVPHAVGHGPPVDLSGLVTIHALAQLPVAEQEKPNLRDLRPPTGDQIRKSEPGSRLFQIVPPPRIHRLLQEVHGAVESGLHFRRGQIGRGGGLVEIVDDQRQDTCRVSRIPAVPVHLDPTGSPIVRPIRMIQFSGFDQVVREDVEERILLPLPGSLCGPKHVLAELRRELIKCDRHVVL